jgi:hypothetical protein
MLLSEAHPLPDRRIQVRRERQFLPKASQNLQLQLHPLHHQKKNQPDADKLQAHLGGLLLFLNF